MLEALPLSKELVCSIPSAPIIKPVQSPSDASALRAMKWIGYSHFQAVGKGSSRLSGLG